MEVEEHKAFTLSEISLHSSKSDCWLLIHGKVYDVTMFLEDHPGGEDVLLEASANGDATNAFEDVGHSSTATSMLSSYLIGVLEGTSNSGTVDTRNQQSSKVVRREGVGFVAPNTIKGRNPSSSASMNLFEYLIPLIIFVVAFGTWYFFNKTKP
ncbi:Cytochrome b5-like heme/steroid binding domain [Macleaya cordata]|uniref:Cytochrome b5-like heme/steroid binding domain n=1 Tax=Macleaya cordata TaxID=56857 RepID=A0A200PM74_MACCD|nr:Cytochrome b5-like heme/steroid binding domain [Macleaya cordata]